MAALPRNRLPPRPRSRFDFDIAIICALPVEADAVVAALDYVWEDDKSSSPYGKSAGDANAYSTGAIGRHNVVLIHLSGMGKAAAGNAAAACRISFPGIELALIVGICGGIPRYGDSDIFLGDVIISTGVKQFDFGRRFPDRFESKDDLDNALGRPSLEIRSLISKLKTVREKERLQTNAKLYLEEQAARYPGADNDRLFASEYRHKHQDPSECDICAACTASSHPVCQMSTKIGCATLGCGVANAIPRLVRASEQQPVYPSIHFGTIASGDIVMRSAENRDEVSDKPGAIAFEMESAGAWDLFPCLVIKGVCDYADSHKDKTWQPFAAPAAAACTKAFLHHWIPKTHAILDDNAAIDDSTQRMRQLLSSLKFPELNARRNKIDCSISDTFEWIFEQDYDTADIMATDNESESAYETHAETEVYRLRNHAGNGQNIALVLPNDSEASSIRSGTESYDSFDVKSRETHALNLLEWLKSDKHLFWITGKPASGKSTLLKFILLHDRTMELLREWNINVHILSHFFWKPGSALQHNFQGFLLSLLYQILSVDIDFLQRYVRHSSDSSVKDTNSDWDVLELEHVLLQCVAESTRPFCIFIDGIDEMSPDSEVHKALNLIKRFPPSQIKVCVSSRCERLFELHFQCFPTLVMHEVTKHDMVVYVNTNIDNRVLQKPKALNMREIVATLVHHADGVFLWLVFATASLIKGIHNGDSEEHIYERLALMPKTLTGLYRDMLDRSSEDFALYHPTSAAIFNIVLHGNPWSNFYPHEAISLFELMVALDDDVLDCYLVLARQLQVEDIKEKCEEMVTTLKIKCAGLLGTSISDDFILRYWPQDKPSDVLIPYSEMAVDFIHRTVGDFLADTTEGQAILKKAKFSEEEMLARVLKAGLVRCRMFVRPQHTINTVKDVLTALCQLRDQLQSGTLSCLLSSTLKAFEDGFLELGECYLYTFDTIEEEFLVCAAELGFDEYVVSHLPTSSSTELQSFVFLRCCQTARFQPDDELSSRQHFLIRHFLDTGISFEAPNQSKGTESGSIVNRQTLNAAWFQYLLSALSWSTVRMNGNHGFTAELVLETCTKFIEAVASTNKTITAVFKWNSHYGNFDIPITMTTLQWHDRQPLSFIRNGLENFIVLEISGRELFESVLSRANKPHHTEGETRRRWPVMKASKFGVQHKMLIYSVSNGDTSDLLLKGVKLWLKTSFLGLNHNAVYQLQRHISSICYDAVQEALSISDPGEDLKAFLSQWKMESCTLWRTKPTEGRAAKTAKLSQPLRRSARIAKINDEPL